MFQSISFPPLCLSLPASLSALKDKEWKKQKQAPVLQRGI